MIKSVSVASIRLSLSLLALVAVVAVPAQAFVQSQPVAKAAVRVSREAAVSAPVVYAAAVAPLQQSVHGGTPTAGARPPSDVSPLEDPKQLDHLITVDQLSNLSRRDLRILRNTVYARHGRKFKSVLLQAYFDNMEWYTQDPAFTEKSLTKIDTTNIRLIKSVEETMGGPLTEDEQRAEENMSGF